MRISQILSLLGGISGCLGTLNLGHLPKRSDNFLDPRAFAEARSQPLHKRQAPPKFLNEDTSRFAVDGTAIPEVDFDVGESYAGLLPIDTANDTNQLYFWFFPSTNAAAEKEILIWLTGGPGCSSVGELLQENGPVLWQPGVFKPVPNKWSWNHLTNVVWVDQPVGSGFSRGEVTARDEFDVARQFMGFWRNFVDLFSLQGFKIYVTGSSYSGLYCPYIAHEMIEANDPDNFNVAGMMIFDALYGAEDTSRNAPTVSFVDQWPDVFAFNDTFDAAIHATDETCGFGAYVDEFLTFPPSGPQPIPAETSDECAGIFSQVLEGAFEINPCFSIYSPFSKCPRRFDPLGFSDGTDIVPAGFGPVYFDRPDVKAAINAPADAEWVFCNSPVFVDGVDESLAAGPGSLPVLPRVIDATQNVLLGHGKQDFVLPEAGALMALQNMTWGGRMGLQAAPSNPLVLPSSGAPDLEDATTAGTIGTWTTERGLTYFSSDISGHFLSADLPTLAFRSLEILLGRVDGFGSTVGFTTAGNSTGVSEPGTGQNGTAEAAVASGLGSDGTKFTVSTMALLAVILACDII